MIHHSWLLVARDDMEKQWEADELEAQQEKVKTGSDINDIKLLEDNNSDLILNT